VETVALYISIDGLGGSAYNDEPILKN